MDFLRNVIEWFGQSTVLIQIYHDTGYLAIQAQEMPVKMQAIHDRLVAWILKDEKKEGK